MSTTLWTYKVSGRILTQHGSFMPSDSTEYDLYVAFKRYKDHEETLRNYLRWYCDCDLEKYPRDAYMLLSDDNCAKALATYHMRELVFNRLEIDSVKCVPDSDRPTFAPDPDTPKLKIWVVKKDRKDVNTPTNAAWELRMACQHGAKISVLDARALVREKFPNDYFLWADVLRAFSKAGGRYTDKYLRMH